MGRRSRSTPKSKHTKPTVVNKNPPPQKYEGPSIASTIGQGMSFGVGAGLGSAAINGVMNSMGSSENKNSNENHNIVQNTVNCERIVSAFNQCVQNNFNDVNSCNIYLKDFKECFT